MRCRALQGMAVAGRCSLLGSIEWLCQKEKAKKTIKEKVRKAKEKLQVIKTSKIPQGMKARIAVSSGQACVMYAGSF